MWFIILIERIQDSVIAQCNRLHFMTSYCLSSFQLSLQMKAAVAAPPPLLNSSSFSCMKMASSFIFK